MSETKFRPDVYGLRFAIAFVWLFTGLAVLHPYYRQLGLRYLAPTGLPPWVMYVTCAGEVLLGLRILIGPTTGWLTALQVIVITKFTVILTITTPHLWANPFGALSKNLPLVFLILVGWGVEREGWNPRQRWLLRIGLASIWIWEGLVPAVLQASPEHQQILSEMGITITDPVLLLRALGIAEIASGLLLLLLRGGALRALLLLQLVGLLGITVTCTWHDPLLWFHPFGPLTKNVSLLIGTVLAMACCPKPEHNT